MSFRIAIMGYGNLGKGVELACRQNDDAELVAFFSRRAPETVQTLTPDVPVYSADELAAHTNEFDVLVICGGSATDLPQMTPRYAALCNVVDSFDTHAHIPEHFADVDKVAREGGHVALISAGWDPGLFSLARCYAMVALPQGSDYTFWGRGVSQGHSDAIRRIKGVLDARQYTVPVPEAIEAVRAGEEPQLSTRDKHRRECYVVAAADADRDAIVNAIVTMPDYFADYDTTVTFITQEEMDANHATLPHGGSVLRTGRTGAEGQTRHTVEFSLNLESNPEFTGSVLLACARGVARMAAAGEVGCKTLFDMPPAYLSALSGEELRAHLL